MAFGGGSCIICGLWRQVFCGAGFARAGAEYAVKLKRKLGFWSVFCIATGAMISSGLFILPGMAFSKAGPAVVLAYALAAVMAVPAMLAKAELATAMPKSGGSYFFVERSLGALPGTIAGMAGWFSIALKSAFAMIGIGAFATLIWPDADLLGRGQWIIKAVAVAGCVVFAVLNIVSVKLAGRMQIVLVAALLVALTIFVVAGVPSVRQHPNFDNFMGKGWSSILSTAALVFVSFGGLTKVAGVGEEVRNPRRNIAGAMFLALAVVSVFYVAAVFVVVGVCGGDELAPGSIGYFAPLSVAASFTAVVIAIQIVGAGGEPERAHRADQPGELRDCPWQDEQAVSSRPGEP